jgi:cytochrome c oxidase assembly protein subunit 15
MGLAGTLMNAQPLYDLTPVVRLALVGATLAMLPLAWWWARHRARQPGQRLHALTLLALFLTFDLVLFGAFTRLTDSGLGCPDWPGCYGNASPVGAQTQIQSAQSAMPSGPVTHGKAWVEMVHRYLAISVGSLIVVLAVASWVVHGRARGSRDAARISPWWATVTLLWVCLQGAFGAWTVTMKLYPAIVTGHLLGGMGLLALLAAQSEAYRRKPLALPQGVFAGAVVVAVLCVLQVALGGWVSTNYAVLACSDFPTCQGSWWPPMDAPSGFTLLRPLGLGRDGQPIPFAALTAIHWVHRLGAMVVFAAIALLAWRLLASRDPAQRRWAAALAAVAAWQFASGLSNVVLDWPLVAAVAHTGGAAMLVTLLTLMLARAGQARRATSPSAARSHRARTSATRGTA